MASEIRKAVGQSELSFDEFAQLETLANRYLNAVNKLLHYDEQLNRLVAELVQLRLAQSAKQTINLISH